MKEIKNLNFTYPEAAQPALMQVGGRSGQAGKQVISHKCSP